MHKDTCKSTCKNFKKREKCPNYGVSSWKTSEGEFVVTHDCAPQRTMIMMSEVLNRVIALQKANDEQRNQSFKLVNVMGTAIETIQKNPKATLKLN